ncbi:MAG TPA: molecular chaperone TorD family protein, partial [Alphaproteobacteria bacterium]|nr:molecular chaperone TorD family protein [Alphaproteobacteria bacterium]
MAPATAMTDDLGSTLARGAGYGLVAHGFRYPDRNWLESFPDEFRRDAWAEPLAALDGALSEMMIAVRATLDSAKPDRLLEVLQADFAAIFGHAVRGLCPAYELEYGQGEIIQRASDLADIAGFYAAFGLDLAGPSSERPDHVCVEAEFMVVLAAKEATGIESGNEDLVTLSRDAQRKFLKCHLGQWVPAFARRVMDAGGDGYYARLARFADGLIAGECDRFGISLGSPYLELRPPDAGEES